MVMVSVWTFRLTLCCLSVYEYSVCLFSVPSKVRELTIIDIKATSIMLSWKPPSENVGDIEVYQIAYHVKEAIDLVPEYLRTTRTNHTVDGLYRSTEYEFRVRTVSVLLV